jgi:hypothetical protein
MRSSSPSERVGSPGDVCELSGWSAVTPGNARLTLGHDTGPAGQPALRLDYDFEGGGGFVVARKALSKVLPAAWSLSLCVRGEAPGNNLEIKFVDSSGRNVWWWRREAFDFPADWQMLRIRSSAVTFAWGPAGGGTIGELGALEIAITAGAGGHGTVWLCDVRFENRALTAAPRITASSHAESHRPEYALDTGGATSWRSAEAGLPAWLSLDFGREHEYGGLIIHWAAAGASRAFAVQCSNDGATWTVLSTASQAEGERSYVYAAGGGFSRYLRVVMNEPPEGGGPHEIRLLDVRPFDFSRSLADFFHAVAACEPRGHHPRWLHREQSFWTPAGIAGGTTPAIMNEEGLLEPDRGSFSLEPFVHTDGELITWADAEITVALARGELPIPSSTWRRRDLTLTITTFVSVEGGRPFVRASYHVAHAGPTERMLRLFVAVRPFQVSPPWQAFRDIGGTAQIRTLSWREGAVVVNDRIGVFARTAPAGFGAAAFEQGGVLRHLVRGEVPPRLAVSDAFGHASGALYWDLVIRPGTACSVDIAVPFDERPALGSVSNAPTHLVDLTSLSAVERYWAGELRGPGVRIGADEPAFMQTLRAATGHILVNRDGPALQPGPRRYMRSWIRDAATMAAALLRMGCDDAVRDFLAWYAPHQAADGNVPCAVDRDGPDWLPEHDSHGEFVFTLAEYFRFTGDRSFTAALWPAAQRAIGYLEKLIATRRTPQFDAAEQRARFGILPESASHEGYLAQPVHAYWDDFWALRGIGDGMDLAEALDELPEAARLRKLREEFGECLYRSIAATMGARGLRHIPGSLEWADFDPSATATAVAITDAAERLDPTALAWTFDEYLRGLRQRRDGEIDWNNYSAYEIRILGALVRLGRCADAHESLEFFLASRRPTGWQQWPEISWKDLRSPGHLGDIPHAWIGAEYVLAVLGMFAYEQPGQAALVVGAGISDAWLDAGVVVKDLPTWWGPLGYSVRRDGTCALRIDTAPGLAKPPGGFVFHAPPCARPLRGVEVDGAPLTTFGADAVKLQQWPKAIVLRF